MAEPFHKRFDIDVPVEEAERRFKNRLKILTQGIIEHAKNDGLSPEQIIRAIKLTLGADHDHNRGVHYTHDFMDEWENLVTDHVLNCLHVTEALVGVLKKIHPPLWQGLNNDILTTLATSEVDLGITWDQATGVFRKTGAQFLDEKLINDPLHWLRDPKFENVLKPFEKGLKHWMEVHKDKERCGDVVTDMYEALEALAKIVTGQERDLSGNREKFASTIKLPDQYGVMLKEYIGFGCKYRHSPEIEKPRVYPSEGDTEAFMYMTGLFIRRAMQRK